MTCLHFRIGVHGHECDNGVAQGFRCGNRRRRLRRARVRALGGVARDAVSPLTAGGIHTALESGWCAAHAIADFLQNQGPDPARIAATAFPRFAWKRALRRLADLPPPNVLYDAILATAPARLMASAVCFHRRSRPTEQEQEDGYSGAQTADLPEVLCRRPDEQNQDGAAAAAVLRRLAIGQHLVALRQPAPDLAFQHRLPIGRGEALAVDDADAAPAV